MKKGDNSGRYNFCVIDGNDNPEKGIALSAWSDYRIGLRHLAEQIIQQTGSPNPIVIDFLTVAMSVFLADVRALRGSEGRRHINMIIPIRCREVWKENATECLVSTLKLLTGDIWSFRFVRYMASTSRNYIIQTVPMLSATDDCERVCLFSEGMDSVAGLAVQLEEHPTLRFLTVTASIQPHCKKMAKSAIRRLEELYGYRISPYVLPLQRKRKHIHPEEPSQRSRSFLLLTCAMVISYLNGMSSIEIYENGIEALNWAGCESVTPGDMSRAMHPLFLEQMSVLVEALFKQPFAFRLPFLFHTKGDVLMRLKNERAYATIVNSVSCLHFSQRNSDPRHCGVCWGCVLRRIGLKTAGIVEHHLYKYDIFSSDSSIANGLGDVYYKLDLLRRILEHPLPSEQLLRNSGFGFQARRRFIDAAGKATDVPSNEINERLLQLYSRLNQEASAMSIMNASS